MLDVKLRELERYQDDEYLPYEYCKEATDDGYRPNEEGDYTLISSNGKETYVNGYTPNNALYLPYHFDASWRITKSEYIAYYKGKESSDYDNILSDCFNSSRELDSIILQYNLMRSHCKELGNIIDSVLKDCDKVKPFLLSKMNGHSPKTWGQAYINMYKNVRYGDILKYSIGFVNNKECYITVSFPYGKNNNIYSVTTDVFTVKDLIEWIEKNKE